MPIMVIAATSNKLYITLDCSDNKGNSLFSLGNIQQIMYRITLHDIIYTLCYQENQV